MLTASALLLALCLGGVSCEKEDAYRVGGLTGPQTVDPVLSLEISSLTAAAGDSVTLALAVPPDQERALGAVLGRLQLDPGKVSWIGEVADSGTIVEVNGSIAVKDGYLRLIAVNPRGLSQRMVTLTFEVTGADYAAGFSFTAEQVVDSAGKESQAIVAPGVSLATGLPAANAVRAAATDRIEPSDPRVEPPSYPRLLGDALANAVIDSVDARLVAAIAVGNQPMPPAGSDDFYAADVTIDAVIDAVDAFVLSEYVDGVPVSQPIGEPVRFVIPRPDQVVQEGVVLNELTIELEEPVAEERALVLMDSIARELGAAVEYRRGVSSSLRLFTFVWPGSQQVDVGATIQALTGLPEIVTAFQGFIVSAQHNAPDDNGWDGYPSGTSAREVFWFWGGERDTAGSNWGWKVLDMPLAWACVSETPSVSVGIVDIGFYHNATFLHTDLAAPISAVAASADENGRFILTDTLPSDAVGHGLAVTGVLGARGKNEAGLTGVMWDSQLRFYQPGGRVDSLNTKDVYYLIREAIADGVNVFNVSLGYRADSVQAANTIGKLVTDALRPGIFNNGRFLAVIAAGSYPPDGRDAMMQGVPQAGADTSVLGDHVLVVSGVGRTLTRRAAANFGSVVDLYAPGEDIQLLSGSSGTRHDHGTSYAAPFVSGAAALLWEFDPTLTAPQVKDYLVRGAEIAATKRSFEGRLDTGLPVLNVYESLKLLAAERPNTRPCGMVEFEMFGEIEAGFWTLDTAEDPPTMDLRRPPVGWPHDDISHDYRKAFGIEPASAGQGTVSILESRYQGQAWTTPQAIVSVDTAGPDHLPYSPLRSMTDGSIVDADLFAYPEGDALTSLPPLTWTDPFGLSHDSKLYAYVASDNPDSDPGTVGIADVVGGSATTVLTGPHGPLTGFWQPVVSPRGDAMLVLHLTTVLEGGGFSYSTKLHLFRFETTIYEDPDGFHYN